jgi:hypothetical protein
LLGAGQEEFAREKQAIPPLPELIRQRANSMAG